LNLRSLFAALLLISAALAPGETSAAPVASPIPPLTNEEDASRVPGTVLPFDLQQTTRRDDRPTRDPVGGFQISVLGGVQMRGSASGHAGLAFSYFKRSTGNVGLELEGGASRGPNGQVSHGLFSLILQSGGRSSKMAPYLAFGGGIYYAKEKLRDRVAEELPTFGIDPVEETESGALIAFGLGIRIFMSEKISFRIDYREMRAITGGSGGLFDRLYSLRRIGGFLSIHL
jgi:hypothetical protein